MVIYCRDGMKRPCMIWKSEGVWLQTYDVDGRMRLSDCGELPLASVRRFCEEIGLELCVCFSGGVELLNYPPTIHPPPALSGASKAKM